MRDWDWQKNRTILDSHSFVLEVIGFNMSRVRSSTDGQDHPGTRYVAAKHAFNVSVPVALL